MGNPVGPLLYDAIAKSLSDLSNFKILSIKHSGNGFKDNPTAEIRIEFKGWSPALLEAVRYWHVDVPNIAEPQTISEIENVQCVVKTKLKNEIQLHRERCKRAEALGLKRPVPHDELSIADISHLLVDPGVFAILVEQDPDKKPNNVAKSILQDVALLHSTDLLYGQKNTLHISSVVPRKMEFAITDYDGNSVLIIEVHPSAKYGKKIMMWNDRINFTGFNFPATIMNSLIGQPISTLVDIHPTINSNIIIQVFQELDPDNDNANNMFAIGYDNNSVPLGTLIENT